MTDSDSDCDKIQNIYNFRDPCTTVVAKGPNVNNVTNLSIRNNMLASTMNMPWNLDRPKYAESVCDQRSLYYRRETSPMSFHSAFGYRPRNYNQSYYPGAMSSQRSEYKRSGSPMSIRTIDSNATVTATDIAMAFKNEKFSKHEFKLIEYAFNKYLKKSSRNRIHKRRNIRKYVKAKLRYRRSESGELGSASSLSSDDCQSVRSSRTTTYNGSSIGRSTRTDLTDVRNVMQQGKMFKDRTHVFRQNSFRNMFLVPPANLTKDTHESLNRNCAMTQQERFNNGYLLPSQRFNQSFASKSVPNNPNLLQVQDKSGKFDQRRKIVLSPIKRIVSSPNKRSGPGNNTTQTDSEQEEIFCEKTVIETSVNSGENNKSKYQSKRNLEEAEVYLPDKKKNKLSSPLRGNTKIKSPQPKQTAIEKSKDFVFAKPHFPIRKSSNIKNQEKLSQTKKRTVQQNNECIIDNVLQPTNLKSTEPLEPSQVVVNSAPSKIQADQEEDNQVDITQNSTTGVSMRPSFIKRKLFTQKLDVDKNLSSDYNEGNSSPANVYSMIQKEKNKTRKLVTSQSCLSRDILGDDSNLLDLIHKIVSPDQMNITSVTNKNEVPCNKSEPTNVNNKWDVTTVIASCTYNNDDSDTYTDEEIFKIEGNNVKVKNKNTENVKNKNTENAKNKNTENAKNNKEKNSFPTNQFQTNCKVFVEKMQIPNSKKILKETAKLNSSGDENGFDKKQVVNCVKSFWDTDIESDMENLSTPKEADHKKGTYEKERMNNNRKNPAFGTFLNKENQSLSVNIKTPLHEKNNKLIIPNTTFQNLKNSTTLPNFGRVLNKISNVDTSSIQSKTIITKSKLTPNDNSNIALNKNPAPNKKLMQNKSRPKDCSNTKPPTIELKSKLNVTRSKLNSNENTNNKPVQNKTLAIEIKPNVTSNVTKNKKVAHSKINKNEILKSQSHVTITRPEKCNENSIVNENQFPESKNESNLEKLNNTLIRRSTRKPKIKKCNDLLKTDQQINYDVDCRTLRNRSIDLSTSFNSDKNKSKKVPLKTKKISIKTKPKNEVKSYQSKNELCMTTGRKTRRSDVSFSLTPMNQSTAKSRPCRQKSIRSTLYR